MNASIGSEETKSQTTKCDGHWIHIFRQIKTHTYCPILFKERVYLYFTPLLSNLSEVVYITQSISCIFLLFLFFFIFFLWGRVPNS